VRDDLTLTIVRCGRVHLFGALLVGGRWSCVFLVGSSGNRASFDTGACESRLAFQIGNLRSVNEKADIARKTGRSLKLMC